MADEVGNGEELVLPVGKEAVDRLIQENSDIFSDTQCKVCCAALISESQKLAHYQSKKHANKVRRYRSGQQGEDYTPAKRMKPAVTATESSDDDDRNKCCPVCNMTFSSPVVAESHYQGKTHAKNLKLKMQGVPEVMPAKKAAKPVVTPVAKPTTPNPAAKVDKVDEDDPEKFCKLCRATFNNPQMSQQHYMGKKHKKQETKNQIMTIYKTAGNSLPQSADIKPAVPGSTTAGKGYSCDICNIVLNSIEQHQAHISGSKHKNQLNSMLPSFSMPFELDSMWNSRKSTSFEGFSSTGRYSTAGSFPSAGGNSTAGSFPSAGGNSTAGSFPSAGGNSTAGSFPSVEGYSTAGSFPSTGGYSSIGGLSSTSDYSSSTSGYSSSKPFSSTKGYSSSGGLSSSRDYPSRRFSSSENYSLGGGYSSTTGLSSTSSYSSSGSLSRGSGTLSGYSSSERLSGGSGTRSSLLCPPYLSSRYNQPYVREDVRRSDGYSCFNRDY
ncbi:zinc finger 346 [Pelobates cultripes]|uniref:Zinc finger protein 346 n=2 Tax=Pelobates cultripes TaxID=61616 RepID=A0AAD1VZ47_PELCU|nr:zinc finger 346 [Pelobates cultripes]